MTTYNVNTNVRVKGSFTDSETGAAVDPSTVTFKFRNPAGSLTTYVYGTNIQLVKDSVGTYHVDVSASSVGMWQYEWSSTGTYAATDNGEFHVQATGF